MVRILLLGDGPQYSTGYSVIIKNLAREFRKRGLEVGLVSMQTQGAPLYWKDGSGGDYIPVYAGTEVPLGMQRAFKDFSADIAIHVRDAFYGSAAHHQPAYRLMGVPNRPKTMILMTPVQADLLPDGFIDVCLNDANFVVTMTKWSMDVLQFQGVPYNRLDWAYAGFDPEVYKPTHVRKEDYGFSPDKQLVTYVGVPNQPRKACPTLVKAASIAKRKVDLELYLHTTLQGGSFDIAHFVNKLGLRGAVILPTDLSTWGYDDRLMAGIYNATDLYCSASSEEGFEMPLLEAFACGTMVSCVDHPNHKEVLDGYAFYAPSRRIAPTAWSFGWNTDPEELAKVIETALTVPKDVREEQRKAQLEHARGLTWEKAADRWLQVFEKHRAEWGITLP